MTRLGKLLRIYPAGTLPGEYSIPPDNPFAGAAPGADEIYSYGLRNPYRFSFDRLTGDLTIGDVGQSSVEEIDFVLRGGGRGANFGWNCFEGSQPFSGATSSCTTPLPNHIPPLLEYPNPGPGSAAVNGGYVIRDGALPSLLGRYIYADTYDVFGGELRTVQLLRGRVKRRLRPRGLRHHRGLLRRRRLRSASTWRRSGAPSTGWSRRPGRSRACHRQCRTKSRLQLQRRLQVRGRLTGAAEPPAAAPSCNGIRATIVGTEGNDVRNGTSRRDVIVGLAGNGAGSPASPATI